MAMVEMEKQNNPTRLCYGYTIIILQLSLRKFFSDVPKNAFLLRPVGHYGPMSVGALTTALAFAPESTQASSSPEQLLLLFRVRFKMYFQFDKDSLTVHSW